MTIKHNYQYLQKVYTVCLNCGLMKVNIYKSACQYWLNGIMFDYEPICHVVAKESFNYNPDL